MAQGRTSLSRFLQQQLTEVAGGSELAALLDHVAAAVAAIAAMTGQGALAGVLGELARCNVQGEVQKRLDVLANEAVIRHCAGTGLLAGMVSEEDEAPLTIPAAHRRGPFLLVFDPLDGSSGTDVNVSLGTIFSVLRHEAGGEPASADFLRRGCEQVAAGYAIYGPATMLVLTVGRGTHGFTFDRAAGQFLLTHPVLCIPGETGEFAVNTSNMRFWEPPVQRYVAECEAGRAGARGRDFNMRWFACLVAEVHRILVRGGVFLYPRDHRLPERPGRLRLLYEANPIALLVEQAGGAASTGRERLLELQPTALHQRVPVILGSRREVERIERYHVEHDCGTDRPYVSPLFNERSLYRPEALA